MSCNEILVIMTKVMKVMILLTQPMGELHLRSSELTFAISWNEFNAQILWVDILDAMSTWEAVTSSIFQTRVHTSPRHGITWRLQLLLLFSPKQSIHRLDVVGGGWGQLTDSKPPLLHCKCSLTLKSVTCTNKEFQNAHLTVQNLISDKKIAFQTRSNKIFATKIFIKVYTTCHTFCLTCTRTLGSRPLLPTMEPRTKSSAGKVVPA